MIPISKTCISRVLGSLPLRVLATPYRALPGLNAPRGALLGLNAPRRAAGVQCSPRGPVERWLNAPRGVLRPVHLPPQFAANFSAVIFMKLQKDKSERGGTP